MILTWENKCFLSYQREFWKVLKEKAYKLKREFTKSEYIVACSGSYLFLVEIQGLLILFYIFIVLQSYGYSFLLF